MKIIESTDKFAIQSLKERKVDFSAYVAKMLPVIREVKDRGDSAIRQYVKQFDKKDIESFVVDGEKKQVALATIPVALKEALISAKDNIEKFHSNQMPKEWWIEVSPGIMAGQIVRPIEKVGCYVPGGRYPLVSTVMMTVLPAKIAGVKEVIVCTPNASPEIIAACVLCGVNQIFEIGGAMAIAAMAYGTETVPKVDKIVGPGNLYVSAAKKIVYGDVGIDFVAGPSEVVIIADEGANPTYIAADLIAQAEHDIASSAICITPSRELGSAVTLQIEGMLKTIPTRETAKASLDARGAMIYVDSLKEAFAISNFLAPEHLEVQIEDLSLLALVENAGSIFLGKYAPEAVGDYASGPNHVLPTGGMAAAQSGLSVKDFLKTPSVQRLSPEGLKAIAPTVIALAEAEGLAGHAESIKVRLSC
jgi:histidinol dehydrogenase